VSLKRFWTGGTVMPEGAGYAVLLDGKPVKTPGRRGLVLPMPGLADAVLAEWLAVEGDVHPDTMPLTRMANTVIDRVADYRPAVAQEIAGFGRADLICYRADGPGELVARQQALWDPWVTWAAESLGAKLAVTIGILPVDQPPEALAALADAVNRFDAWGLVPLHALVTISGSLVLGLATALRALDPDGAIRAMEVDEAWQTEQWGQDALAQARTERLRTEFGHAIRFLTLQD